jgi:putative Flp pilus-assembly TadE/G-like protein
MPAQPATRVNHSNRSNRSNRSNHSNREAGSVTTIFAVLLAGSVLLGMLAISADIGNIMWERRQVQNAADSSALALAQICALDTTECDTAVDVSGLGARSLQGLLDSNSNDGRSSFATAAGLSRGQCGRRAGTLPPCASAGNASNLGECPPLPTWLSASALLPYVETHTTTATAGGGTSLFTPFADVLTRRNNNVSVTACARASWGPPSGYSASVPVTISVCEWVFNTNSGADFVRVGPRGTTPGYGAGNPWPDASKERVILLHDPSTSDNCAYKGKDTDGGFGYLDPTGSGCSVHVDSANPWAEISTGNSAPSGCTGVFAGLVGRVIALPVFDCITKSGTIPSGSPAAGQDCTGAAGGGAKTWYHIKGWAKFYLSGYRIGGSDTAASVRSHTVPCGNPQRCLSGWFLKGTLDASSITAPGGDGDLGTYAILPAG